MVKQPTTAAKTSSNSAMLPPDEMDILRQANKAFDDYAHGTTLSGFATQRLAYAIQCHHTWMQQDDDKPAALSACIKGSEARKMLLKVMVQYFAGVAEKAKILKTKSDQQIANIKGTRSARVKLIGDAFTVAVILDTEHVRFSSFNVDKGTYAIPGKMFAKEGDVPLGRLADKALVPIANEPAAVQTKAANGEPRLLPIRTSVKQLVMANTPKAERDRDGSGESVEQLVKELHDILLDPDAKDTVHKDAYPDATWNYLGAIAAWYDKVTNNPDFIAKPIKVAA